MITLKRIKSQQKNNKITLDNNTIECYYNTNKKHLNKIKDFLFGLWLNFKIKQSSGSGGASPPAVFQGHGESP